MLNIHLASFLQEDWRVCLFSRRTDSGAKLYGWHTPAWSTMDGAAVTDQHPALAVPHIKAEWRVRSEQHALCCVYACCVAMQQASQAPHSLACALAGRCNTGR